MAYRELEVNTKIKLKEKLDDEDCKRKIYRTAAYTVVAKYPCMCIVEDERGRRRGVAVGELVMNRVITQEPRLESLRREAGSGGRSAGRHCRSTKQAAEDMEYAP